MANLKKKYKLDVAKVGAKLKALRRQHNFVQDDLSQFLGVTRSAYASIERGTYGTRVEVLAKIVLFYAQKGIDLFMEELIDLDKFLNHRRMTPGLGIKIKELETDCLQKGKEIESLKSELKTVKKTNAQLSKVLDKV